MPGVLGRFVPSRRLIGAALTALSLSGCANFWDDVTSRDFHLGEFFHKPNPYLVLRDSDDGNRSSGAGSMSGTLRSARNRRERLPRRARTSRNSSVMSAAIFSASAVDTN